MLWKKNNSSHSHSPLEAKHSHSHGSIDASLLKSQKGLWALKWSFILLMITAVFQAVVVYFSGSVALFADTIHNFADAATAIPLAFAFWLARKKPNSRFHYGYGRLEDLAGLFIVAMIFLSAVVAAYESIHRFFYVKEVTHLSSVFIASLIGFIGNEAVAWFRIYVGKQINSAALIADGYHAQVDALTSLGVLVGSLAVYFGFPLADPILGVVISCIVFVVVWQTAKAILVRLLDGVEEQVMDDILHAATHAKIHLNSSDIKARWLGHELLLHLKISVPTSYTLSQIKSYEDQIKTVYKTEIPYLKELSVEFFAS